MKFIAPKHLGYVCDPALTGVEHVKQAHAAVQGKAQGASPQRF